jgi:hypothetical protein
LFDHPSKLTYVVDKKWEGKLRALGMTQGSYLDEIVSPKLRSFLAKNAVNYLYVANMEANVVLKTIKMEFPCISIGSGNSSDVGRYTDLECTLYEQLVVRAFDKIVKLFEEGQDALLETCLVDDSGVESGPEDNCDKTNGESGEWEQPVNGVDQSGWS